MIESGAARLAYPNEVRIVMRTTLFAVALVLVVAAAGCGGSSSGGSSGSTEESGGGTTTVGDEATLEVDDNYFKPSVVSGEPGSSVKLELDNEGRVEHNFSIDAQGVDQDLEPGEDASVTVKIPKSGTVAFYCKYHRSAGMEGSLQAKGGSGGMTNGTGGGTTGY